MPDPVVALFEQSVSSPDGDRVKAAVAAIRTPDLEAARAAVRGVTGLNLGRSRQTETTLQKLLRAKFESDRGNYRAKGEILHDLMLNDPKAFFIDQDTGGRIVGLTHGPTRFKIHSLRTSIPTGVALPRLLQQAVTAPPAATKQANWFWRLLGRAKPPVPGQPGNFFQAALKTRREVPHTVTGQGRQVIDYYGKRRSPVALEQALDQYDPQTGRYQRSTGGLSDFRGDTSRRLERNTLGEANARDLSVNTQYGQSVFGDTPNFDGQPLSSLGSYPSGSVSSLHKPDLMRTRRHEVLHDLVAQGVHDPGVRAQLPFFGRLASRFYGAANQAGSGWRQKFLNDVGLLANETNSRINQHRGAGGKLRSLWNFWRPGGDASNFYAPLLNTGLAKGLTHGLSRAPLALGAAGLGGLGYGTYKGLGAALGTKQPEPSSAQATAPALDITAQE